MIIAGQKLIDYIASGKIIYKNWFYGAISVNSIDVRLGYTLYRLVGLAGDGIVDPYKDSSLQYVEERLSNGQWILLPGHYLGTTIEKIGTSPDSQLVPDISSKSSAMRWGITTSLCAGKGDVGYADNWTLEIQVTRQTILKPGTVIAQVRFTEAIGSITEDYSIKDGNYMQRQNKMLPKTLSVVQ